ncbi:hypothetical protein [Methylocaldum sp. GT1BB]|uniref:hypothetical protein n=1 Tax=Methylocaldum sp. GT1BB TaxID=3438963 RepID=UPI003DA1578A
MTHKKNFEEELHMRKISTLVLSTSLLITVAPCALSDEDSRYPAHHFKPSVIYQDHQLIAQTDSHSSADSHSDTHADPKYPGSSFTPTVIYQNPEFVKK